MRLLAFYRLPIRIRITVYRTRYVVRFDQNLTILYRFESIRKALMSIDVVFSVAD